MEQKAGKMLHKGKAEIPSEDSMHHCLSSAQETNCKDQKETLGDKRQPITGNLQENRDLFPISTRNSSANKLKGPCEHGQIKTQQKLLRRHLEATCSVRTCPLPVLVIIFTCLAETAVQGTHVLTCQCVQRSSKERHLVAEN